MLLLHISSLLNCNSNLEARYFWEQAQGKSQVVILRSLVLEVRNGR